MRPVFVCHSRGVRHQLREECPASHFAKEHPASRPRIESALAFLLNGVEVFQLLQIQQDSAKNRPNTARDMELRQRIPSMALDSRTLLPNPLPSAAPAAV